MELAAKHPGAGKRTKTMLRRNSSWIGGISTLIAIAVLYLITTAIWIPGSVAAVTAAILVAQVLCLTCRLFSVLQGTLSGLNGLFQNWR